MKSHFIFDMWPITHHNLTSEGFSCIILLLLACESKSQQAKVKFYYWSCDLIEHDKVIDWFVHKQYAIPLGPDSVAIFSITEHLMFAGRYYITCVVTYVPWMRLCMLMVYSRVTTSFMADFFLSPFFGAILFYKIKENSDDLVFIQSIQ